MRKWPVVLLIGLAVAFLGVRFAVPVWRAHREDVLIGQAKHYWTLKDFQNSFRALTEALERSPTNLEACRLMADLSDATGSADTLLWRSRVAQLAPTVQNRLALASTALRLEPPPFPLSTKTLEQLATEPNAGIAFHTIAAERAIRLNLREQAEYHLETARAMEPTNSLRVLNLAVLGLSSDSTVRVQRAVADLKTLIKQPDYKVLALRSLVAFHCDRGLWSAAKEFSAQMMNATNAAFSDKVQHLTVLQSTGDASFRSYLESLKEASRGDSEQVAELANWLNAHAFAEDAAFWLTGLSRQVQDQPAVRLALANSYIVQKDWKTLASRLAAERWQREEYLRLAMLSQAYRSVGLQNSAAAAWEAAVAAAQGNPHLVHELINVGLRWSWTNDVEALLWRVLNENPSELWSAASLDRLYRQMGNTAGLLRLYSVRTEREPTNSACRRSLATARLLLSRDTEKAHHEASELYSQDSTNVAIVCTYVLSLHLQGQDPEALKALEQLQPATLQDPMIAAYYAKLLSVDGQAEKAMSYRRFSQGAQLLPEERQLLTW